MKSERQKWYKNADEIACFLSSANKYWDEEKWKDMMYSHLEITEKEAYGLLRFLPSFGKYKRLCVYITQRKR